MPPPLTLDAHAHIDPQLTCAELVEAGINAVGICGNVRVKMEDLTTMDTNYTKVLKYKTKCVYDLIVNPLMEELQGR
jgi:hypothetical protein